MRFGIYCTVWYDIELQPIMIKHYIKTLPQFFIPKKELNLFAGFMANIKTTWIKNHLIERFVRQYQVNMSDAQEENPRNYACFNDFFIRRLKPGVRPKAHASVVSPVDGVLSEKGPITQGQLLQAKGWHYSVQSLLACNESLAKNFEDGFFATFYLSPKDYHRIHMPIDGTLKKLLYVPGKFFSVQPATVQVIPQLFSKNERLVALFDTPLGLMAMVLVGAAIVGKIGTRWHGDIAHQSKPMILEQPHDESITLRQCDELGYFKLGSTVIVLFAKNLAEDWQTLASSGKPIQLFEALTKS